MSRNDWWLEKQVKKHDIQISDMGIVHARQLGFKAETGFDNGIVLRELLLANNNALNNEIRFEAGLYEFSSVLINISGVRLTGVKSVHGESGTVFTTHESNQDYIIWRIC